MHKPDIKALLFDMGGVVVDVNFEKIFESWAAISALNEVQIKSRFEMDEHYQQHEKGFIDASAYFDHVRRTLQLTGTDHEIAHGWNTIFGSEIEESFDAIDSVRNEVPSYGFTNTNRTHQIYWEQHYPRIRNSFEKLFVSSEIGLRKPEAEAFLYILKDIAVEPEELLFFDDSPENIEGASQLGIQTVLVTGSASVITALNAL